MLLREADESYENEEHTNHEGQETKKSHFGVSCSFARVYIKFH